MGRAHVGRAAGRAAQAAGILAITALGLTGCIPGPPPVPQPASAEPVVQGATTSGEVRDGRVASGATTEVELQIDERAAVMIGATSTDDEDLTLRLRGPGVDIENDDASSHLDVFEFELQTRDSALGSVLDPGTYTIEIGEFSDDASGFRLQVLTSTTVLPAGTSAELPFGPGAPALVIVPLADGRESISGTSEIDTVLWAYLPTSDTEYRDDDSGGERNPRIDLLGERPQDAVVVANGYARESSGSVLLSVE